MLNGLGWIILPSPAPALDPTRPNRCCCRDRSNALRIVPPVSKRCEGLLEFLEEVVAVLHSHREPDQAVANPDGRASLRWHRGVGHRRRMADQALHAPQRLR